MNHKLRVLVRVDADPGHVTLEVTGCLTQSDFPALLHVMRRAGRLGAGSAVTVDLHGASHLDPEILLQLRSIADASAAAAPGTDTWSPDGTAAGQEPFRITLAEPADLPICLVHVGSDGEVLAGLEGELAAVSLPDADGDPLTADPQTADPLAAKPLAVGVTGVSAGLPAGSPAGLPVGGHLDPGVDGACSPIPDELNTINGLALSDYFEGALDPAATVRALSDVALGQLADALYRHLDTSSPAFGAHTWYELATEELQNRHLGAGDGPAEGELAAGPALA